MRMNRDILSVREIQFSDIGLITSYWIDSDKSHLESMGVDINKLPTKEQFEKYLRIQIETPIEQKESYSIIWQSNKIPIGHCNTRPTIFGEEAHMHLHIWNKEERKKGIGYELVKLTLPLFFENLKLKDLYCEPYALNPAPNRIMEKTGFELEKEHKIIPGAFNFEQPVKRWHLSYESFKKRFKTDTSQYCFIIL